LSEKKIISIITPSYNEEGDVLNLYNQVREVMAGIGKYEYEHILSTTTRATALLPS
jgi:hypothetical protein